MSSKKEMRQIYKVKRDQLGPEKRALLSTQITEQALIFLSGKADIEHIHIFLPIEKLHEINTFPIIKDLQEQGKKVYTSVSDIPNGQMKTVKLATGQQINLDFDGIPVPAVKVEGFNSLLQVVFLPLLAYDLNGHRIGYGKGIYDRFVAELPRNVLKIGLSFFPPEVSIPSEKHDVALDLCINPEGVVAFK